MDRGNQRAVGIIVLIKSVTEENKENGARQVSWRRKKRELVKG